MHNLCIFNGDMSRGGGTERMAQILANSMSANGKYNITILNLNNKQKKSFFPLNDTVKLVVLPDGSISKKVLKIREFVKKNAIDVVINVDVMLGIYTFPLLLFYPKLKIISWEMFNIKNDIGSKHTRLIRQIALYLSRYYITLTAKDKEAFETDFKVHCPLDYIYNPICYDQKYNNYKVDSKIIMTAGHFYFTKGYDLAVEVARRVFFKHPDWEWRFYGDGVEENNIENMIKQYGLEKNVYLMGRTDDINEAYQNAGIYVMTSRTEGFGLVLTEAKSLNLPTVAFDCEFGPGEIIENDVSGFLIPAFDVQLMAERICELIENGDKRLSFSMHARDNLEKFSIERFIEKWDKILDSICTE